MLFPVTEILPFTRQILALLGILIMQYARLGNVHHCIARSSLMTSVFIVFIISF